MSRQSWAADEEADIKLYPDNPTTEDNLRKFRHKGDSEFFDPCAEAASMSMKCLERNDMERKPCKPYFEAYRDCMAAWRRKR